jgi:uncharacterized protein YndB with AHSA1/START domain
MSANIEQATSFMTPSDTEIVISRTFAAPRRLVWDAWTEPEHISGWMLGPEGWRMPICEVDLRPGGSWRYVWRNDDGTEMAMTGVCQELDPPSRMVITESWGGQWPSTVNTLELTEQDGRTLVTETVSYPSKQARDAALGTGMTDGISLSFERLDQLLASLG